MMFEQVRRCGEFEYCVRGDGGLHVQHQVALTPAERDGFQWARAGRCTFLFSCDDKKRGISAVHHHLAGACRALKGVLIEQLLRIEFQNPLMFSFEVSTYIPQR